MGGGAGFTQLYYALGRDASWHYATTPVFAGLCKTRANGCVSCNGGFGTITVHARYGNFDGVVLQLPSGQPVPNTTVGAFYDTACNASAGFATTGQTGYFNFAAMFASPRPENDWGVHFQHTGVADAPVTETFTLVPQCLPCAQGVQGSTTSSQKTTAVLSCPAGFMEDPSIRPGTLEHSGPPAPAAIADMVSVTTGNLYLDQTDVLGDETNAPGLRFVRSYNSSNVAYGRYGMFGPGWSHAYEKRLSRPDANDPTVLLLREGNGVPRYFADADGDGTYETSVPFSQESTITQHAGGTFVRKFIGGGSEHYAELPSGRLTAFVGADGESTALGHDTLGRLLTITGASGELVFTYPTPSKITLSGPSGLIATFTLEAGLLTRVDYADETQKSPGGYVFAYQDAAPRRLLTVGDTAGRILRRHVFGEDGKGIVAETANPGDKFSVTYEASRTIVMDARRGRATYELAYIWGQKLVTRIAGQCSGCKGSGAATQEWTYDSKGWVTSHRDGSRLVTYPTTQGR